MSLIIQKAATFDGRELELLKIICDAAKAPLVEQQTKRGEIRSALSDEELHDASGEGGRDLREPRGLRLDSGRCAELALDTLRRDGVDCDAFAQGRAVRDEDVVSLPLGRGHGGRIGRCLRAVAACRERHRYRNDGEDTRRGRPHDGRAAV